jgi:hypothetical protein
LSLESEKWKAQRLLYTSYLWEEIRLTKSATLFQSSVGSFFSLPWEWIEPFISKTGTLPDMYSFLLSRYKKLGSMDVKDEFTDSIALILRQDLISLSRCQVAAPNDVEIEKFLSSLFREANVMKNSVNEVWINRKFHVKYVCRWS